MNFKEFFTPERVITKLGAIKFPTNIFKEEKRTPHYEMDKALTLYETRPMVNSGVKQLARFMTGNEISVQSGDERTHNFLNKWIRMRPNFDNEVFNMIISGLVTGNIFIEKAWKKMSNGMLCLDNIYNINDCSRVYYNLDYRGNDDEFWLYEVPIEIKAFPIMGEMKTPKFYKVNYVYGSYLFQKMIWAVPIHKNKIAHCKLGWSRDNIYGRSFLASAIDDGEVLTEILKNYSVIARYRAIGRKIFSIGTPEDPAGPDDIDKLESDLKNIEDKDHIIINKEIKSEPLSFTGENDPMDTQIEFLRRDISSGIIPNFLTPWNSEVNRATAGEVKIPFELEINSFKSDLIQFLNKVVIDELRKVYPWIAEDATFTFGVIDLESKEEKINYGSSLYQLNIITLNELRKLAGYEAIEGGDVFYKDLAGTPMGESVNLTIPKKMVKVELKEQATVDISDDEWMRKMYRKGMFKEVSNPKIVRGFNINGRRIRMLSSDEGYFIYDGITLLNKFEKDEKDVADFYFNKVKEKRQKALDEFYDEELPEHKVMDDFYKEIKRLNAEVINEVFKEIPKNKVKAESWFKEQTTLGAGMLPKLDGIFSKFNDRISSIVDDVTNKLFGIVVGKTTLLGPDVEADEAVKRELKARADILKQRTIQELKTMNEKMKTDIFRSLSDGITARSKISDIQQELKDKYASFKTKENPQDWQISRVVRTELNNSTIMMKLLKWKEMGFDKVEHITKIDDKTGEKDRKFNRRIFDIEYLLNNEEDRIPLHPSCRCTYVAYE